MPVLRYIPIYSFILIMAFLVGGCGTSKSRSVRKHTSGRNRSENVIRNKLNDIKIHGIRKAIVEEALSWEGTPYKYADAEKGRGTDCSGLVLRVYQFAADLLLPRNSAKQEEYCRKIKPSEVIPGDLAFFATGSDPTRVSHVGLMIDDRHFIHASSRKGVVISDITTPYYQRTFISFGRVPGM